MVPSTHALRLPCRAGVGAFGRHDVFRLPALGASAADARARIRERLCEWGAVEELRDDAGLVVTELFTNAVRHTASEKITCALHDVGTAVRIEVTDQGRGEGDPVPCAATADDEGGRGLLLVSALAAAWGSDPAAEGTGRVVWAELAFHRAPHRAT